MNRQPKGWTRLLAGAGLTLLVASMFAPDKASAACGDYVTVNGRQSAMANHQAAVPGEHQSSLPPAPCPCRGPNCSQQPNMPFSPSAPVRIVALLDWAFVFTATFNLHGSGSEAIGDLASIRPSRRTESIFHPPKSRIQ